MPNSLYYNSNLQIAPFQLKGQSFRVVSPQTGNILAKIMKANCEPTFFVVTKVSLKNGLVHDITLNKILTCHNGIIQYDENNLISLSLSGAGTWFTKNMLKSTDWNWITSTNFSKN